jgi:crossover junction endodeoxyribonuclease RuvC
MIVLGIDPGLGRCGYGVIDYKSNITKAIDYGCIFTDKDKETSHRLIELFDKISSIIRNQHPDVLAIEDLFFNTNAKTVIKIGEARGVILLAAQKNNVPVVSYPPLEIKMAITGYGRAEKEQIQKMVKNILHLDSIPKPDDTADALAVALTYCLVYKFKSKL